MADQKEFKRKELNKNDYQNDKNVVNVIKNIGKALLSFVGVYGIKKILPFIKKD